MQLRVTGADDLRRAAKQLRTVADGKAMRRDLVAGLRKSTKPSVAEVKRAALNLPAKHSSVQQRDRRGRYASGFHSGHNLRRRMAAATSAQIRTGGRSPGVKVRISRARMGDKAAPAQLMNRASWRHPVYGTGRWVTQRGVPGWFERANRTHVKEVRRGVQDVLNDVERKLSHR